MDASWTRELNESVRQKTEKREAEESEPLMEVKQPAQQRRVQRKVAEDSVRQTIAPSIPSEHAPHQSSSGSDQLSSDASKSDSSESDSGDSSSDSVETEPQPRQSACKRVSTWLGSWLS